LFSFHMSDYLLLGLSSGVISYVQSEWCQSQSILLQEELVTTDYIDAKNLIPAIVFDVSLNLFWCLRVILMYLYSLTHIAAKKNSLVEIVSWKFGSVHLNLNMKLLHWSEYECCNSLI
jgi:hypothetical protein